MIDLKCKGEARATGIVALVLLSACILASQETTKASTDANALYRAGSAAVDRNDLTTAVADFQKAVHLDPASGAMHSALGFVLLKTGRVDESVPEFEQALKKRPTDTAAATNLAAAYEQLGQFDKEVTVLARLSAVERSQKLAVPASTYAMYARALSAIQRIPDAIVLMQKAVAANPHDANLLDSLGSLYAMQQEWPNAERNFHAALALNPGMASAHLHLGLALAAQLRPGVEDELATAYRLAPDNPVVNLEYGRRLAPLGRR